MLRAYNHLLSHSLARFRWFRINDCIGLTAQRCMSCCIISRPLLGRGVGRRLSRDKKHPHMARLSSQKSPSGASSYNLQARVNGIAGIDRLSQPASGSNLKE